VAIPRGSPPARGQRNPRWPRRPLPPTIAKNLPNAFGGRNWPREGFKFRSASNRFMHDEGALRAIRGRSLGASRRRCVLSIRPTPPRANRSWPGNCARGGNFISICDTRRIWPDSCDHASGWWEWMSRAWSRSKNGMISSPGFSLRENEWFQKVSNAEKAAAFLNMWTSKEALLKAPGRRITRSLSLVAVSFCPGETARLLDVWEMTRKPRSAFAGDRRDGFHGSDCDSGKGCHG